MITRSAPPFRGKSVNRIVNAITAMEEHQKKLSLLPFSPDDLLWLFINPNLHKPLVDAYRICEPTGHVVQLFVRCEVPATMGGGTATIRFEWHGLNTPNAFYVPYRKGSHYDFPAVVQDTAPDDLRQRFEQVSQDLIGIAYSFAAVTRVFRRLNRHAVCATVAQMRYHWPCIVPILHASADSDLADAHVDPSVRAGDLARIPQDLRPWLTMTNEIVARHTLIADAVPPKTPPVPYVLIEKFVRTA